MHYNTDSIRARMKAISIRTMDIEQIPELRNRFVHRLEEGHDVEFQRLLLLSWILGMSPNDMLGYRPVIQNTIAAPVVPEHIGAIIRGIRLMRSITQDTLAQQCGISVPTLYRIEVGEKPYHTSALVRICNALQTSPEELEMMYRLTGCGDGESESVDGEEN